MACQFLSLFNMCTVLTMNTSPSPKTSKTLIGPVNFSVFIYQRRAVALMIEQTNRMVCDVLLDQDILPGVGNIIKNEVRVKIKLCMCI
jgi:formamidopyrimidine-DNA glycosylase